MERKVKRTDKKSRNRTELLLRMNGNVCIAITVEESSSHVSDKWTFQKIILIPSVFDNCKWDQLAGEKFCLSYDSKENAVAYAYSSIKTLSEWVQPNNRSAGSKED